MHIFEFFFKKNKNVLKITAVIFFVAACILIYGLPLFGNGGASCEQSEALIILQKHLGNETVQICQSSKPAIEYIENQKNALSALGVDSSQFLKPTSTFLAVNYTEAATACVDSLLKEKSTTNIINMGPTWPIGELPLMHTDPISVDFIQRSMGTGLTWTLLIELFLTGGGEISVDSIQRSMDTGLTWALLSELFLSSGDISVDFIECAINRGLTWVLLMELFFTGDGEISVDSIQRSMDTSSTLTHFDQLCLAASGGISIGFIKSLVISVFYNWILLFNNLSYAVYLWNTTYFVYAFLFFFFSTLLLSFTQQYLSLSGVTRVGAVSTSIFLFQIACILLFVTEEGFCIFLEINLFNMYSNSFAVSLSFGLDTLSGSFCILILFISLCAILYSYVYIYSDQNATDFVVKLLWFSFSMTCLVLSRNIVCFYLFWEFIGITSAWLINFNSQRLDTLKSALKAFSFNKLSDLAVLGALLIGYCVFGSSNMNDWFIFLQAQTVVNNPQQQLNITVVALLLLLASSIKSAQFALHIWLPDSMDAPVPASALIHSATLVSAGVYVLLRFSDIFIYSGLTPYIASLGAITAAYGGIVAGMQTDLKKALAYSTISHCGFLFVSTTLGNFNATITYLILHGAFKALSFMCAGEAIRYSSGYQDLNRMGGLVFASPSLSAQLFLAMANLCGFPFFLGYLFKNRFQTTIISNPALTWVLEGFCIIGLTTSLLYFSKIFYSVCFSFKKFPFKLAPTQVKKNQFFFKFPIKSPLVLIFIFWFMYLLSIACVYIFFKAELNTSVNISNVLIDYFYQPAQTTLNAVEIKKTENYFFFFIRFLF